MATPRTNQLDINLSRISDTAVREAMSSLVTFVNSMSQGLRTGGDVKGKTIANDLGNAGLEKAGTVFGSAFRCLSETPIKWLIRDGELGDAESDDHEVPEGHIILGAFGWTQVANGSNWIPMRYGSTGTTDSCYISTGAAATTSLVRVTCLSATAVSNGYRIIVFYIGG